MNEKAWTEGGGGGGVVNGSTGRVVPVCGKQSRRNADVSAPTRTACQGQLPPTLKVRQQAQGDDRTITSRSRAQRLPTHDISDNEHTQKKAARRKTLARKKRNFRRGLVPAEVYRILRMTQDPHPLARFS